MVMTKIKCIHCESEEVVKNGKRATGIQSLKCKNCGRCFQESYLRQDRINGDKKRAEEATRVKKQKKTGKHLLSLHRANHNQTERPKRLSAR